MSKDLRIGSRDEAGYSLIEVLVAMLLLTLVSTGTVVLFVRAAAIERRAEAQLSVVRSLEAQHEALRAGMPIPLVDGRHVVSPVLPPRGNVDDYLLTVEVEGITPGLYRVTLDATYRLGTREFRRMLEIRLWRP